MPPCYLERLGWGDARGEEQSSAAVYEGSELRVNGRTHFLQCRVRILTMQVRHLACMLLMFFINNYEH